MTLFSAQARPSTSSCLGHRCSFLVLRPSWSSGLETRTGTYTTPSLVLQTNTLFPPPPLASVNGTIFSILFFTYLMLFYRTLITSYRFILDPGIFTNLLLASRIIFSL